MPGMRPLLLPQMVAAGSSSLSIDDIHVSKRPSSSLRSQGSSPEGPSEPSSSPLTSSFSSNGPGLSYESTSSLNSASSSFELPSFMVESKKLSGVVEEPTDRRDDIASLTCSCMLSIHGQNYVSSSKLTLNTGKSSQNVHIDDGSTVQYGECDSSCLNYDWTDISMSDYADATLRRSVKRRRSADTSLNSVVMRVGNRLPSLSTRWRDRKSAMFVPRQPALSSNSSRSSSLTGSVLTGVERRETALSQTPNTSVAEQEEEEMGETTPTNEAVEDNQINDPVDRKGLASTPLLPPVLAPIRTKVDTPVQSPLQSPSIADPSSSFNTAANRFSGVHSPALSTRPSVSSLRRGAGHGQATTSIDLPPIMALPPSDEWALRLGHANFTINPEPYLPEVCNRQSCQKLFTDWELARRNYNIHQVRTGEHFGVTSKTYKLTEAKWAAIEAQWKKAYDDALARVAEANKEPVAPAPIEPAPLAKMPSLYNPKGLEKFPELGDEDIVGPMVQLSKQAPRRTVKVASCFKFLKGLKMTSPFSRRPSSKY